MGVTIEEVDIFFPTEKTPWGLWGVSWGDRTHFRYQVIITGTKFLKRRSKKDAEWKYHD